MTQIDSQEFSFIDEAENLANNSIRSALAGLVRLRLRRPLSLEEASQLDFLREFYSTPQAFLNESYLLDEAEDHIEQYILSLIAELEDQLEGRKQKLKNAARLHVDDRLKLEKEQKKDNLTLKWYQRILNPQRKR